MISGCVVDEMFSQVLTVDICYALCILNLLLWFHIGLNWISSTIEDDLIIEEADSPEVVDDFELGNDEAVIIQVKDKEVNKQKLRRRIDQYKVGCVFFLLCNHGVLGDFLGICSCLSHMKKSWNGGNKLICILYFMMLK